MRVLHVIPSVDERSGGPATAILPMCRALIQQGVEVLLVTTDSDLREGELPDGPGSQYKGVPAMFFPSQLGRSFKYSRPLASWLDANIQHYALVHIHAVFNHSSVAAAHLCRKAGVPYIVRPLGTLEPWSMKQKSLRKRLFWPVSGKAMLQGAAAVQYTTEAEKLSTEALFGLDRGRVVPLGIEPAKAATNGLAQHFPALAEQPYVLVLSRLHPKKGLDVLIDAFFALVQSRQFANWRLVIAGDGPADYVLKLKRQAAGHPHRERIAFTGWLDNEKKAAVLSHASLLCLPSYQENFGLCVMESLSYSVPVLVSPQVNLAAEISAVNAGWISAIDQNELTATLAAALGDEDELARRGRAGKALSQKYSWENTAHGLASLYRDLIEQRNGSAHLHRI
jgi:glycosyltransferase involved in cell wall biosynthesis